MHSLVCVTGYSFLCGAGMAKVLDMPGKGKLMHSLVCVTGYSFLCGAGMSWGCSVATGP